MTVTDLNNMTEKEYLEATKSLKDILFNSKNDTRQVKKDYLVENFKEAMQWVKRAILQRKEQKTLERG